MTRWFNPGRAAWLLLLSLLLGQAALATESPQELVKETSNRMLEVLAAQRQTIEAEPDKLYGLVSDIVLPHFDFELMARWVLGKYWRRATPEQQQRFVTEFRTLLVRTYSTALLQYTDQKIEFLPTRMQPGDTEVTVSTKVVQQHGNPIPIDYRMHLEDNGWKVYDVTIDGISLVTNYRSSFSDEIRRNGMDALIDRLAARNKQDSHS